MNALLALAVIAGIGALLYYASRSTDNASDGEQDLLQLCRGDREQMERLIAHEQRRTPAVSRKEAITRAASSIRRDNR